MMHNTMIPHPVQPLFQQVRNLLTDRIARGIWKPGQQLPNELQLAHELGISIGTMRRALTALERDRLITRMRGRGSFVADQDPHDLSRRFASFVNQTGARLVGRVVQFNEERISASCDESEKLQLSVGDPILRLFRVRETDGHRFMTEASVIPLNVFPEIPEDSKNTAIDALARLNGIILRDADELIQAVPADPDASRCLELEPGSPLLSVETMVFAIDGRPVEWRMSLCRTDFVRYRALVD